jgi:hypothetical protein
MSARGGRTPGVARTRWEITEEDRRVIARQWGESKPVTLREARHFMESVGYQGLQEAYNEAQEADERANG